MPVKIVVKLVLRSNGFEVCTAKTHVTMCPSRLFTAPEDHQSNFHWIFFAPRIA